jgi:PhzF family phenazine biosynthesis protein
LVAEALALFSYSPADLDARIAPAIANAGANHLVLALNSRERLSAMRYELDAGRTFSKTEGIVTISLVYAETARLFHVRNPFPIGGVYEDPATGAAAAALAGYLRDLGWPHGGAIEIVQGEDMGARSRLYAEIPFPPGASVRVSGMARMIS